MKLSFALKPSQSTTAVGSAPSLRKPSGFGSLDDDDNALDENGAGPSKKPAPAKRLVPQSVGQSKATRKKLEAELDVDQSIFDYDEHWEKIQDAREKQKEAKELDAKARKPKYIEGLLNTAATRKLDYLRAQEKLYAREREQEGDEYADKDEFVTQAYKDQQAEVRQAEAEEKAREEALRKKNTAAGATGMTHFYKKLLQESEAKHEETVSATEKKVIGPSQGPNLTIQKPPEPRVKSDAELAQMAKAEGKDVELNDDNQIVDKRELLSAGLNLSMPNSRRGGPQKSSTDKEVEKVEVHRAVGIAASRREINERRQREIESQLEGEQQRVAEMKAEQEAEALRRQVTKRNTEVEVSSARDRYLARKRQKLEQPPPAEES